MRQTSNSIAFGSVVLPASLVFVRGPNIVCDMIVLSFQTNAIAIGTGAGTAPLPNTLIVNTNSASFSGLNVPTGGNVANLWFANASVSAAQTVSFMCVSNFLAGV
jgi:hypothetical protein